MRASAVEGEPRTAVATLRTEHLIRAVGSRLLTRLESLLNYVCPKSLILYATKGAST